MSNSFSNGSLMGFVSKTESILNASKETIGIKLSLGVKKPLFGKAATEEKKEKIEYYSVKVWKNGKINLFPFAASLKPGATIFVSGELSVESMEKFTSVVLHPLQMQLINVERAPYVPKPQSGGLEVNAHEQIAATGLDVKDFEDMDANSPF